MIEIILFVIMIVLAIMAIETTILRNAVVFLGIFSLIASFVYLLNNAPDVAIAEAVIGSALVTLLYLTALRRYRIYTICFTNEEDATVADSAILEGERRGQLLHDIEEFCISRELEPQVIYTPEAFDAVSNKHDYDLIIRRDGSSITVYGKKDNFLVDEIEVHLILRYQDLHCKVVRFEEEAQEVPA